MSGWVESSFASLCRPRREIVAPSKDGANRYVGLEGIEPLRLSIRSWAPDDTVRSSKFRFRKGDLLFAKLRPYQRKAAVAEWDGVCSTDILVLEPLPTVDPYFLGFLTLSTAFIDHAIATTEGVNLPRTSWPSLARFKASCPSPKEQEVIADVLLSLRDATATQDQLICALRELKTRTSETLLQIPDLPTGNSDKEGSVDSEDWTMANVGDFFKVGNGSTPARTKPEYWVGGEIPWLNSGKVHEGTITQADQFVTDLAQRECHLPLVPSGSVVVAITGQGKTLGNAALLRLDATVNQHLAYMTPRGEEVSGEYLAAYLGTRYEDLRRRASAGGTTKGALTCSLLEKYPLPICGPIRRRVITDAAAAGNAALEASRSKAANLGHLLASALDLFITGKLSALPSGELKA